MTQGEAGGGRRRRRRGRRGGGGGRERAERDAGAGTAKAAAQGVRHQPPDWNWRGFPVIFAFSLGIVVMGILVGAPPLDTWTFILGLLGVSFGVAHIATRMWFSRRQRRD